MDERYGTIIDSSRAEVPHNEPSCQVRQEIAALLIKNTSIDCTKRQNKDCHTDADPKGTEHSATVALLDVEPA
jgi:hypothetical protein